METIVFDEQSLQATAAPDLLHLVILRPPGHRITPWSEHHRSRIVQGQAVKVLCGVEVTAIICPVPNWTAVGVFDRTCPECLERYQASIQAQGAAVQRILVALHDLKPMTDEQFKREYQGTFVETDGVPELEPLFDPKTATVVELEATIDRRRLSPEIPRGHKAVMENWQENLGELKVGG